MGKSMTGRALIEKIKKWDREVGKIILDGMFERWIELNAPMIVCPFSADRITPLDHSDITFSIDWSKEEGINLQRFGIGAFFPERTRPLFTAFLLNKAGEYGLEWLRKKEEEVKDSIVSYSVAVDGKKKEWKFYLQSLVPEKAIVNLTVSFDGKKVEEKEYSYDEKRHLCIAKGERGKRYQFNIYNVREQEIALAPLKLISPELEVEVGRILSLGFSLDTISYHYDRERIALYFEPLFF